MFHEARLISGAEIPVNPSGRLGRDVPCAPEELAVGDFVVPITLLALVIRLTVALVVSRTLTAQWLFSQATELGCIADSVLAGRGFSSPFCGDTGPSAFLAPGYPLLVAGVFRLFGPYSMHSAMAVVFVQALFGTATVPVAMWAANTAFGKRAANATGILCAFNPWLIGLEAVLWESSLSIFLVTSLLGLALSIWRRPSRSRWYSASLVLSVATCVNPSLLPTGIALLGTSILLGAKSRRAEWLAPAVLLLCVCSLWPLRNFRTLHAVVLLRSNMGYELWQGNRPNADGFFEATLHPNANAAEFARYKGLGEIAYMREKSNLASSWIKAHPGSFLTLTLRRAAYFWLGIGRKRSLLLLTSTASLSFAGLAALVALARAAKRLATFFAVPLIVLPLPYYISHPDFRFWCLLAPTLTVLCAWWLTRRWSKPLTAIGPLG